MTFVIKGKYVEPHLCNTPPQTVNNRLVPGDLWKCDDCGRHHVWSLYYGDERWTQRNERQTSKILKRHRQGKPFKRLHSGGLGPG